MPLGTEIGLGLRDSVRWDPAPTPLKEHSPQFSAIVGCGQTAGWTKMPLGMEVGLGSGDFVFDGGPARRGSRLGPGGAQPPQFSFRPPSFVADILGHLLLGSTFFRQNS